MAFEPVTFATPGLAPASVNSVRPFKIRTLLLAPDKSSVPRTVTLSRKFVTLENLRPVPPVVVTSALLMVAPDMSAPPADGPIARVPPFSAICELNVVLPPALSARFSTSPPATLSVMLPVMLMLLFAVSVSVRAPLLL